MTDISKPAQSLDGLAWRCHYCDALVDAMCRRCGAVSCRSKAPLPPSDPGAAAEVERLRARVAALDTKVERMESVGTTAPTGGPVSDETLRHNAYATGWEHGAFDYRPSDAFNDRLRGELARVAGVYWQGRKAGRAARSVAWDEAKAIAALEKAR